MHNPIEKKEKNEEPDAIDYKLVDILYKECEFHKNDTAAVDERIFRLISIVIVPFFLLIGYLIFQEKFRSLIIVVPFLSIVAVLALGNLFQRYVVNWLYIRYLENKINHIIGKPYLFSEDIYITYYTKWLTLPNATLFLSIAMLTFLNIIIAPAINNVLKNLQLPAYYPSTFEKLVGLYWIIIFCLVFYLLFFLSYSFVVKHRQVEKIILQRNDN